LDRDQRLLDRVDWTIRRGEHWVVLGRNGAGKTLLLRILTGYLWPSQGRVSVLGHRYGTVDLRELRRGIGWVSSALAERIPSDEPVLSVVLSGPEATLGLYREPSVRMVEKARALMERFGLAHLENRPFGDLSAGERQRTILARSLLADPRLLILDEPSAGLDLAARERFLSQVQALAAEPEGPTLIMVTHRVEEIVPGFTHGLLLKRGQVMFAGPLAEALTDERFSQTMEIGLRLERPNGRWRATVTESAGPVGLSQGATP
jgi:iron complex transport system ATP-binding protein